MKRIIIVIIVLLTTTKTYSQVGIGTNTPEGSAQLEVKSTNKGLLIPQVALTGSTDALTISSPANSLLVYNTATTSDVVKGYYYNSGTSGSPVWLRLNTSTLVKGTNSGETINWNSSTSQWQITGTSALALGNGAGQTSQGNSAVALGNGAGNSTQGTRAIALGTYAGYNNQAQDAIALGNQAGYNIQGANAIALGVGAGSSSQAASAIALGYVAGNTSQGNNAIALGDNAGYNIQSPYAISLGSYAGNYAQGNSAIALGYGAGYNTQGTRAIALGYGAGQINQGNTSIAIGYNAGVLNQPSNSIILNASGTQLEGATASSFYVKPIRGLAAATAMYYNTATSEITYLTSDARLKRNILTIKDGLNSVKKLNPVSYEYRESLSDSVYVGSSIGFLAQELKQVVPNAVSLVPGPDSLHAVDLSVIIPILVSAVKELEQKNEKLQTRLTELEKFQPRNRRKNRP